VENHHTTAHKRRQHPHEEDPAREARTLAEDIVDTMREPLLILDGDLYVHSANRAFYHAFHVSAEETRYHLVYELGSGQWDVPALRTLLEDVIPFGSVFEDFEMESVFPAIGSRVVLLNARPLQGNNRRAEMVLLAMEDVTERRRVHDREVHFTAELRESYRRLQELERLRDDLTHMIIHDLRTPLTSVMAGMQTLEVVGDLNEEQREVMGLALGGGETLLGMINDLLDVEKLESGSVELDHAVLCAAELVASAVGQVASLAESKPLTLVRRIAADLPPLRGDEDKLRRTLVNLLGNAIKFTPAGGTVTVGVRIGERGQSLEFSVSDTGEGIPAEAFGRIFEKFGQVETRQAGRARSTGLGLAFCKMAVEAHGGRIWVESVPGRGSIFWFTIPVTDAPRTRTSPA
jgi:signal transduction histidine kinase